MRKRTKVILFVVCVVIVLLAATTVLRMKAPPRAARLLPRADAFVYFDLKPVRQFTHFDRHPIKRSAAYQKFIDATGFVFERDLDQAAFAIERMPNPNGPNGAYAFSEVFVGRMNEQRMRSYLASIAGSTETYRGRIIYHIPSQQRTVRVAILSRSMVAVSNTPTSAQIHSILDRYRKSALPFSGSPLLMKYYSQVPLLSPAWAIGKAGKSGANLLGFRLPIAAGSVLIGSVRWTGSIHLKVEEIAPSDDAAADSASAAKSLIALFRAIEDGLPKDSNDGLRQVLQSAQIEQHRNRATLTATIPNSLAARLLQAPNSFSSPSSGNSSSPAPAEPAR